MNTSLNHSNEQIKNQEAPQPPKESYRGLIALEDLLSNIVGGIELCEHSPGFPILYVSDGFCKLVGYSRTELATMFHNQHLALLLPQDQEQAQAKIQKQLAVGTSYELEYRIKCKDDKMVWILDKGVLVSVLDHPRVIQRILIDITTQKELEQSLRISEKRYEIALESTSNIVFDYIIETNQIINYPGTSEKYGLPDLIEGGAETIIEQGAIHPNSIEKFRQLYKKINVGEPFARDMIVTYDKEGNEIINDFSLTNIFDTQKKPLRAIGVIRDITQTFLLQREKEYGDSLASSKQLAYEANISKNKLVRYDQQWVDGVDRFVALTMTDMLAFIAREAVMPEHQALFLKESSPENIISACERGQKLIYFEYRQKDATGEYHWYEKTINIVKDEITADINVRCYVTNIDDRKEKELRALAERHYCETMLSKSATVHEVNISKNIFISGNEDWGGRFSISQTKNYNDAMLELYKKVIHPDDREGFYATFSRKNVLTAFQCMKTELAFEYRRPDGNKEFAWARCTMHLFEDPYTGDVKAFSYVEKINEEKVKELELIYKSQHDLLTGFYNKISVEEKIDAFLESNEGKAGNHAFFIIDLDHFKAINDHFGHAFGDAVLSQFAGKIKALFRENDIWGRIGGDEFVILVKNILNPKTVNLKAQEVCAHVREVYTKNKVGFAVSVSVGIAFFGPNNKTYQDLYHHSDAALYYSKQHGRGQFTIYQPNMDTNVTNVKEIDQEGLMQTKQFSENISEYVFRILYESSDKKTAINSVLELVGKHYHVNRTYVFENSKDGAHMNNTFEWCSSGIEPQKQHLQNVPYKQLGDYAANFNEEGIFYLPSAEEADPSVRQILQPQNIKSMIQFSFVKEDKMLGFIGFDQCDFPRIYSGEEIGIYRSIANSLGIFIMEMRAVAESKDAKEAALSIVNGLNSYAYVCDPETYEVLFANNSIKKIAPHCEIGQHCYQAFWLLDAPCGDCPMERLKKEGHSDFSIERCNPKLGGWSKTYASWINWLDGKRACLVDSIDITSYRQAD